MAVDTAREIDPWAEYVDEESDEPMAASEHGFVIHSLFAPLYTLLRSPTRFITSEVRVYRTVEDIPRRRFVTPDVMVALDVSDRNRPRYVIAQEGKAPDLVIEVLSEDSVTNRDLTDKRRTYQELGVREYVVVDPLGKYAPEPRVQIWRFAPGDQVRHELTGPDGVLRSHILPVGWTVYDDWVYTVNTADDARLPLFWEAETRLEETTARLDETLAELGEAAARLGEERGRREALEAEVERLRRLLNERG